MITFRYKNELAYFSASSFEMAKASSSCKSSSSLSLGLACSSAELIEGSVTAPAGGGLEDRELSPPPRLMNLQI